MEKHEPSAAIDEVCQLRCLARVQGMIARGQQDLSVLKVQVI